LEFRRVLFRSDGRRYFYFWHYERDNGRFAEEGGLRRPGGLRQGAVGPPPSNGRRPSEGGAGVRPASGADRGPRWRAYLHLEVRSDMIPRSGANSLCSRRDPVLSPAPPLRSLMSPPAFGGGATWPTTT